jgi:hypothetical protein
VDEGQQLEAIGRLAVLVHRLLDQGVWGDDAARYALSTAEDQLFAACERYLGEQGEQKGGRE